MSERTSRTTSFYSGVVLWEADCHRMKCTTYGTPPPPPCFFHLGTFVCPSLTLSIPPIHALMSDNVRRPVSREALLEEVRALTSCSPSSLISYLLTSLLIPPSRRSFTSSIWAIFIHTLYLSLCLSLSLIPSFTNAHSLCLTPPRTIFH